MDKNAKIYVAGHTGMVGSGIVRALLRHSYTNLLLKTRSELDLFDIAAVRDFFQKEKPEYVIVAAAKVGGIAANNAKKADFLYENLLIQNNVIWQAHGAGVKKLLFLASSCIYPRECKQPMKEEYFMTGPVEPTNAGYAIAKIAGVELCRFINEQYGNVFVSCMPTNVYGPGDNFNPDSSHVLAALIKRIHEAKVSNASSVMVWGTGKARREFMHVDDLGDAIVFLFENFEDKQFINVGTGEDISIKELAELLKKIVRFEGEIEFDTSKPDGMPRKWLDVTRLRVLGYKHKINLEEGLRAMYDWYVYTRQA